MCLPMPTYLSRKEGGGGKPALNKRLSAPQWRAEVDVSADLDSQPRSESSEAFASVGTYKPLLNCEYLQYDSPSQTTPSTALTHAGLFSTKRRFRPSFFPQFPRSQDLTPPSFSSPPLPSSLSAALSASLSAPFSSFVCASLCSFSRSCSKALLSAPHPKTLGA